MTSSIKREVKKEIVAKNSFESLFFFVAAARKFNFLLFLFSVPFFPESVELFAELKNFVAQVRQYKEVSSDFSARIWRPRSVLAVLNKGEYLLGLSGNFYNVHFFLLVLTLNPLFTILTEELRFGSWSESPELLVIWPRNVILIISGSISIVASMSIPRQAAETT